MEVKFKKVRDGAQAPKKHNYSDAGYDLFSCERHVIDPMQRGLIPVGISIEIPFGYYARIAPRSGLAVKKGICNYPIVIHCCSGEQLIIDNEDNYLTLEGSAILEFEDSIVI